LIQRREGRIVAVKVLVRPPPRKNAPIYLPTRASRHAFLVPTPESNPASSKTPGGESATHSVLTRALSTVYVLQFVIHLPAGGYQCDVLTCHCFLRARPFTAGTAARGPTGAAASRRGAGAAVDSQPRTHPLGRARRGSGCARSFLGFIGSTSTTRWAERSNTTPHMCVLLVPCCT